MASISATFNFTLLATLSLALLASGFQFDVGERRGWTKPTGKERETYNEWASQNRFHIGDTVYFKYKNDSVLVVNSAAYTNCDTSNPIKKFNDGNTVFEFDRPGPFYFISGESDHCKSGQKITIRVMHPVVEGPAPEPTPVPVPTPAAGGGSEGDNTSSNVSPPHHSGSSKVFVVSSVVTAAASLLVFLYIVM